jgi:CRP-like cAMP-binding protein
MGVKADAESLRRIAIFAGCETVPLQVLAFAAERQRFAAGQVIVRENDAARSAYFLLEGSAAVHRGKEVIGRAEPGSLIGETAMLGSSRYMVSAEAETEVLAARIDTGLFERVVHEYPEFGRAVLGAMSDRLGTSIKELEVARDLLERARGFSSL